METEAPNLAWHFVGETLRDGRPIPPDGETLRHDGPLVMCESGLHFSRRLRDALQYAPGEMVCRVRIGGEMIEESDKGDCRERTILWRAVSTETLREFARLCALDVVHLWDAPEIALDYLRSGDETKRDAAKAAAWTDTASTSASAASAATWAAASAASAATYASTWAATTRNAAGPVRDAACAAVWAVSLDAAASDAAWDAARDAAWDAQNDRLTAMIMRLAPEH